MVEVFIYYFSGTGNAKKIAFWFFEFAKKKEQDRINRCKTIVSKLKQYFNIEIDGDELLSKVKGMIGRPHIAKEIIKAGWYYVKKKYKLNMNFLSLFSLRIN